MRVQLALDATQITLGESHIRAILRYSRFLILGISIAFTACKGLFLSKPTDEQALTAVRGLIDQGGQLLSLPLPAGVAIASVKVDDCQSAQPQEGANCKVSVTTQELPIIGGVSTSLTLRFVEKSGSWQAYLQ